MRAARVVVSVVLLVGLASSCALRPRYRDFVTAKTDAKSVQLLVTNGAGAPMPNVKVELSELKNRVAMTSAADGTFALPVEKKYLDENPVLVLLLPQGTSAYSLTLAPPPLPPMPVPALPSSETTPSETPAAAPADAPTTPSGTTPTGATPTPTGTTPTGTTPTGTTPTGTTP
ncbi:MAG: hypothetical protein Q8S33_22745 [Myxococcales bacterium]|nr:hypothetical protein [Myxococcales bacterium]MDP3503169.1 hypothetical protein [Myxococcales bacterium]